MLTTIGMHARGVMLASWLFNRYGDQYFLSKIWLPSADSGRELSKCRLESKVAAQTGTKSEATAVAIAK